MKNPFKRNQNKPKAEPKVKAAKELKSEEPKAEEPTQPEISGVRANPCPNCGETNWTGITEGLHVVEKQHKCMSCGYVITEQ